MKMSGIVEIDETYIGGKQRGYRGKLKNKDAVIGIRERGGPLKLVHVDDTKKGTVYDVIAEHVSNKVEMIVTDESPIYNFKLTQYENTPHETIKHRESKRRFTRTQLKARSLY